MKVENMKSPRTGRDVPNQFIIKHKGITTLRFGENIFVIDSPEIFQSYESVIGIRAKKGTITLDEIYWNYSKTTSKYRNIFLGETTKETQAKFDSGEYILTNLN